MDTPEIDIILIKFLNKSANSEELDKLDIWIQDPENELIFRDFVKTHFAIIVAMNDPDSSKIREQLLNEIQKEKNFLYRIKYRSMLKYAAVAIIFIGIGYYFQNDFFAKSTNNIVVEPKVELITLELENGNIQVISEDGTSTVVDAKGNLVGSQNRGKLVYNDATHTEKLTYNTLTVPYGKRFDIVLSDGTSIFLNSGSSIKYPVQFIKGQSRQVFLNGEAFFDVAEDKLHPFIIDAQELNVEVLGTKFNVSTYKEDSQIEVVLVEGSVELDKQSYKGNKEKSVILKPGFNGVFNKKENSISTSKVNTSLYTSWMTGNVVFRNAPFREIAKKLERVYNVSIIINNEELANENFNASIEVDNETIEEVLNYFNKFFDIEFEIINNKILIN
ncbi:hypothetical protein AWE51_15900 [Aquimarina aggregata]|uniref:Iron dicitrate transport regulator FecR n=1 Tax=Aquimarina aggregata TaxID=1642818 RepID=A0A162DEN3_9FLAO|nr:FecR family protein [Aquimarina aggregata]KZS42850.1 hypothetical protein AWE51_15900 [Aquimarina aggregata]